MKVTYKLNGGMKMEKDNISLEITDKNTFNINDFLKQFDLRIDGGDTNVTIDSALEKLSDYKVPYEFIKLIKKIMDQDNTKIQRLTDENKSLKRYIMEENNESYENDDVDKIDEAMSNELIDISDYPFILGEIEKSRNILESSNENVKKVISAYLSNLVIGRPNVNIDNVNDIKNKFFSNFDVNDYIDKLKKELLNSVDKLNEEEIVRQYQITLLKDDNTELQNKYDELKKNYDAAKPKTGTAGPGATGTKVVPPPPPPPPGATGTAGPPPKLIIPNSDKKSISIYINFLRNVLKADGFQTTSLKIPPGATGTKVVPPPPPPPPGATGTKVVPPPGTAGTKVVPPPPPKELNGISFVFNISSSKPLWDEIVDDMIKLLKAHKELTAFKNQVSAFLNKIIPIFMTQLKKRHRNQDKMKLTGIVDTISDLLYNFISKSPKYCNLSVSTDIKDELSIVDDLYSELDKLDKEIFEFINNNNFPPSNKFSEINGNYSGIAIASNVVTNIDKLMKLNDFININSMQNYETIINYVSNLITNKNLLDFIMSREVEQIYDNLKSMNFEDAIDEISKISGGTKFLNDLYNYDKNNKIRLSSINVKQFITDIKGMKALYDPSVIEMMTLFQHVIDKTSVHDIVKQFGDKYDKYINTLFNGYELTLKKSSATIKALSTGKIINPDYNSLVNIKLIKNIIDVAMSSEKDYLNNEVKSHIDTERVLILKKHQMLVNTIIFTLMFELVFIEKKLVANKSLTITDSVLKGATPESIASLYHYIKESIANMNAVLNEANKLLSDQNDYKKKVNDGTMTEEQYVKLKVKHRFDEMLHRYKCDECIRNIPPNITYISKKEADMMKAAKKVDPKKVTEYEYTTVLMDASIKRINNKIAKLNKQANKLQNFAADNKISLTGGATINDEIINLCTTIQNANEDDADGFAYALNNFDKVSKILEKEKIQNTPTDYRKILRIYNVLFPVKTKLDINYIKLISNIFDADIISDVLDVRRANEPHNDNLKNIPNFRFEDEAMLTSSIKNLNTLNTNIVTIKLFTDVTNALNNSTNIIQNLNYYIPKIIGQNVKTKYYEPKIKPAMESLIKAINKLLTKIKANKRNYSGKFYDNSDKFYKASNEFITAMNSTLPSKYDKPSDSDQSKIKNNLTELRNYYQDIYNKLNTNFGTVTSDEKCIINLANNMSSIINAYKTRGEVVDDDFILDTQKKSFGEIPPNSIYDKTRSKFTHPKKFNKDTYNINTILSSCLEIKDNVTNPQLVSPLIYKLLQELYGVYKSHHINTNNMFDLDIEAFNKLKIKGGVMDFSIFKSYGINDETEFINAYNDNLTKYFSILINISFSDSILDDINNVTSKNLYANPKNEASKDEWSNRVHDAFFKDAMTAFTSDESKEGVDEKYNHLISNLILDVNIQGSETEYIKSVIKEHLEARKDELKILNDPKKPKNPTKEIEYGKFKAKAFYMILSFILIFMKFANKIPDFPVKKPMNNCFTILKMFNDNAAKLFKPDVMKWLFKEIIKGRFLGKWDDPAPDKVIHDLSYMNFIYNILASKVIPNKYIKPDGNSEETTEINSFVTNLYTDICLCYHILDRCKFNHVSKIKNATYVLMTEASKQFALKIRYLVFAAYYIGFLERDKLVTDLNNFISKISDTTYKSIATTFQNRILNIYDDISKINSGVEKAKGIPNKSLYIPVKNKVMIDVNYILDELFKKSIPDDVLKENIKVNYDYADRAAVEKDFNISTFELGGYLVDLNSAEFKMIGSDVLRLNMLPKFSILAEPPKMTVDDIGLDFDNESKNNLALLYGKLNRDKFFAGGNTANLSPMESICNEILNKTFLSIYVPYEKTQRMDDCYVKVKKEFHTKMSFMSFVIQLLFFILTILLIAIIAHMVYQWFDRNNIVESFKAKRKNKIFNRRRTSHYYL